MKRSKQWWIPAVIFLLGCGTQKVPDLVEADGITSNFHRRHVGRILFCGEPTEGREYAGADEVLLSATTDLYITILLENSLTNFLHRLAPDAPLTELDTAGNFQFSLLVDGNRIYTSNLHPGAPYAAQKHQLTRIDKPLVRHPAPDLWSASFWNRFLGNGGKEALTPGRHTVRMEVRPYLTREETLVGDLIAAGNVTLNVVPPTIAGVNLDSIPIREPTPYGGLDVCEDAPDIHPFQELKAKIEAGIYPEITSIVVLKEGKILAEEYYNGSDRESLHDVRSVGKSFTSTLVGMAIAGGFLRSENQNLGAFYDLREYLNFSGRKAAVTLYDLLTMSSSFLGDDSDPSSPGNEELMYPTDNWVQFALNLPVDPDTTRRWKYFTAGVVVLGDILDRNLPGGLEAYAAHELFTPMGISSQVWQHTPQGVANTAGGIQMTSLDFAKYGLLYARKGKWEGRQLLPEAWVRKTFSRQLAVTDRPGEYYGYLFWEKTYHVDGRDLETFYSAGNGGNKIFVFPGKDLVVVVTATAYNMPYAHPQVDEIMEKYVLPAVLGTGK